MWSGSGELFDEIGGYLTFVGEAFPVESDWLVWRVIGAFSRETLEQSPELHGPISDGARFHLPAPVLLFCLVAVPLDLLVQEGY